MNFHALNCAGIAQSEVHAHVVGGEIAAAAQYISALAYSTCSQIHSGSHCVPRTPGASGQLQFNPMVVVGVDVAKQHGHAIHIADDDGDLAVVEDVSKSCSTANADSGKAGSFHCWNDFELSILEIVKEQGTLSVAGSPVRMLVNLWVDVAVGDKQILPAVVIIVEKSISKSDEGNGGLRDANLVADVGEGT